MAARFAYVAGATGILANFFLIVLYVRLGLQAWHPGMQPLLGPAGELAGPANDPVGSLGTALMIPVALFLAGLLPRRRAARFTQAAGLTALAVLTVGGPLLVFGVLPFEVQTPIAIAALLILSVWLFLVNRWLRLSDALPIRLARFGEFVGAGFLAGYVPLGWVSCCPGGRGRSLWCSAPAWLSGCLHTLASRCGS